MESRAHNAPAPQQGPRNLAAPVAAWLRQQDFTATEYGQPDDRWVLAYWLGPQRERFELTYHWQGPPVPGATCWLTVRYAGETRPETLVAPQHVRRVRDVRQLLANCVRYAEARLPARPVMPLPTAP